jgi:alpha-galactosidase
MAFPREPIEKRVSIGSLSSRFPVSSLRIFLVLALEGAPMKTFTAAWLASFLLFLALLSFADISHALDNGLALTPPMGWNSWNKFGCNVSEDLIKSMADGMASSGMKDAGYQYVVIDDCWQVRRDENGNIVPDAERFPSGMKALGDYIHGKGLKFGIYSDAGEKTCAGRPGSLGHEYQDALLYAKWGVDYLKYDWCHTGQRNAEEAYSTMRDALKAAGRPVVFSMCEWGTAKPWLWATNTGNLWRTTGDINDQWEGKQKFKDGGCCGLGMLDILDLQVGLETFAGPGHWNDPDMLEVGNGGMKPDEYRTQMSLWAILAAPLIAGNDLTRMDETTKSILINKEVIAVDQDQLGIQGHRVVPPQVWARPLSGGTVAVALFNFVTDDEAEPLTFRFKDIGFSGPVHVRDLWAHRDLGVLRGSYTVTVPQGGVVMLRLWK